MVFNRTKFDRDFCVSGEKRFQELDPDQFKPQPSATKKIDGDATWAECHLCQQLTLVKRNGFFVSHHASQQGYKGQHDKRSGTPPRTRRS